MLPNVHIRKEAFLIMLWAAQETFKSECFGFLWGRPPTANHNRFLVNDAVPFQSIHHRLNTEVEQSKRGEKSFKKFMSQFDRSAVKRLGHFHSHDEWGKWKPATEMSEHDIKDMIKNGSILDIIVAVNSRKRGPLPWTTSSDGQVRGSLGKLIFQINAYTLDIEEGPPVPLLLHIVAPAAIKALNRAQQ